MPPVYTSIKVSCVYDGLMPIDLRPIGINLIYLPNFLDLVKASDYYQRIVSNPSLLAQHSYLGNFNRKIVPKRLTYAHVPQRKTYRFKGRPLYGRPNKEFIELFNELVDRLPSEFLIKPDSSIINGYRYNGTDLIACHTDDEKFLMTNNTTWWSDSTVATLTLLRDPSRPMNYYAGDPASSNGVAISLRHGSLILQGSVLHEVKPVLVTDGQHEIGRVSITLRTLRSKCHHPSFECLKPNCPQNLGPSNYLYYSNFDSLDEKKVQVPSKVGTFHQDSLLDDEIIIIDDEQLSDIIIDDEQIILIDEESS